MLENEFLTQDIDILPDVAPSTGTTDTDVLPDVGTDVLPEGTEEEVKTEETKTEETKTEEETTSTETTGDSELDDILAGINTSQDTVTENLEEAGDKLEGVKDKVEEAQADPENSEGILKEIYQDLLETETALQASEVAKDVALAKVSELQAQVSELEINAAGQSTTDNPDLLIINKLINAAEGGSDVASKKVKDALNKIYLWLFNSSIEEWQVQDNLEWLDGQVSLNDSTLPVGEVKKEEEPVDINDVTSIL